MRHHHFICDRCGNVEDVDWYDVPKPAARSLGKRVVRECQLFFAGSAPSALARTLRVNGANCSLMGS